MYYMVDHGSVTPLYVQLADVLSQKIEHGDYAPGQRLPSADDLAEEYDVAPNTARKGLRLLRERGLAEMSPGRGTYVRRKPELCWPRPREPPWHAMACHGNGGHAIGCHPRSMRQLDPASRLPPWEQVAAMLRAEIAAGRYEDSPMPALDYLAEELHLNRKTIRKAYLQLITEGLVETLSGRGYYVRR